MTTAGIEVSKVLRKNLVLLGRCIAHNVEQQAKVRIKRLLFDENLNMYFREFADIYVHDPKKKALVGDIVLIKKLSERLSVDVGHEVSRVLYPFGDITDPISGKKCVGRQYRDAMTVEDEAYGRASDSGAPFDYDKAPPRGWQEGKKDFSSLSGYKKWHEFEPGHPLYNDPAATI